MYDTVENSDAESDSDDDHQVQTVFQYPLLEDFYEGSLKVIDD